MKSRNIGFAALLLAIAFIAPMVAFAGVTTIWPESTTTADVASSPAITFDQGADYPAAQSAGFAGSWSGSNSNASYDVTVSGLSGGTVTIDDLVTVSKSSSEVTSYKMRIETALSGTLSNPDTLKIRLWTGATAPSDDGDAQVCGVLDLEASAATETAAACTGDAVKVQLIYALPDGATGSSTVGIGPSSIVFA